MAELGSKTTRLHRTLQGYSTGFVSWLLLAFCGFLCLPWSSHAAEPLRRQEWTVDRVVREALVYVPRAALTNAVPLVFVFHGHGGTMGNAMHSFGLHHVWPEAMVVYPQGLKTAGRLTDPEGRRAGWQPRAGDCGDRDLKFFDAMFAGFCRDYHIDTNRVYATGHSNGGAFSYLLWAARGERFAAVAPSGAAFPVAPNGRLVESAPLSAAPRAGSTAWAFGNAVSVPKPVLHIAGEADPLVKFQWQKATMAALRLLNQCGEGESWGQWCTMYHSKVGAPVVTFVHPGGHQFPPGAPAMIVKFFRQAPQLSLSKGSTNAPPDTSQKQL